MAIALTLRGLTILDISSSLLIFYILQKNEENLLSIFWQNAPSNSIHLTSLFSQMAVSNASLRVKVCENDDNI